jgi:5-methylcytosine-specific restriction endonuclease McrA
MAQNMTKTAVKRIQVEERKAMRAQFRRSAFMTKTRNIHSAQARRAAELGLPVEYTVDALRGFVEAALVAGTCCYCSGRLTLSRLAVDHALPVSRNGQFTFANLRVCCQSCNWRKGKMTAEEFEQLSTFVTGRFPSDVVADIWRRLVVGGKWSP